jgi:DNA-binding NarL/FixJ family response regulator
MAKKLMPDVVLLDLGLRSLKSLKVLETIKNQCPRTEVVVMDLIPAHTDMMAFIKAGVSGFVPKDATLDDFLKTIRTVVKGVKVLPPTISNSLFSSIVELAIQDGALSHVIAAIKFSKRERDVIYLLAQGKTQTSIAYKLRIVPCTVKSHVRNVLDKLALHSRLELAGNDRTRVSAKRASPRR